MRHITKNEKLETRAVIQYFCKKGMPRKEIHGPLEGAAFLQHSEKWAAEFKKGRESVGDDERSGRPKDATAEENVKVVHILASRL